MLHQSSRGSSSPLELGTETEASVSWTVCFISSILTTRETLTLLYPNLFNFIYALHEKVKKVILVSTSSHGNRSMRFILINLSENSERYYNYSFNISISCNRYRIIDLVQNHPFRTLSILLHPICFNFIGHKKCIKGNLVNGIEPLTSGLWAQRATTAPYKSFLH